MSDSELKKILSRWLANPEDNEILRELELQLSPDPVNLETFRRLRRDFKNATGSDRISKNPFFFSKLVHRMEQRGKEEPLVNRVRWAVYTATISFSIVFGVLLGNQVQETESAVTETEIFAEELLIDDYSIETTLMVDVE